MYDTRVRQVLSNRPDVVERYHNSTLTTEDVTEFVIQTINTKDTFEPVAPQNEAIVRYCTKRCLYHPDIRSPDTDVSGGFVFGESRDNLFGKDNN